MTIYDLSNQMRNFLDVLVTVCLSSSYWEMRQKQVTERLGNALWSHILAWAATATATPHQSTTDRVLGGPVLDERLVTFLSRSCPPAMSSVSSGSA